MKKQFEILRVYRKEIIQTIDDLNLEQLQLIPKGYNNNIFWNIAHCLATQQTVHYKFSGLETLITNDWIENYKNGTQPKFLICQDEVEYLKRMLISSIDQLEQDYNDGKFETYTEYKTSSGITLSSIEDAINLNNVHEGVHYGIIKTIKKMVV